MLQAQNQSADAHTVLRVCACVYLCLPDISDQWMFFFLLFQQIGQVSPHTQCITLKILFHNHIQDGQSDGTRHWVTTKLRNSKPHTERKDYTKVNFTPQRKSADDDREVIQYILSTGIKAVCKCIAYMTNYLYRKIYVSVSNQ